MQPAPWVARAIEAVAQTKKVLVVEGKKDSGVYQEWLQKHLDVDWTNRVYLEKTDGRSPLLAGLRWLKGKNIPEQSAIFGLADRDEWEAADVTRVVGDLPTLLVNQSRHMLENYFCAPDDLEAILLARDTALGTQAFSPYLPRLRQVIETARKDYVEHWALGCVIYRANERIRHDAAYPSHFRDVCPLPQDSVVKAKLREWSMILDADSIFAAFDKLRQESLARPVREQFRSCIEAKLFFGEVVMSGPDGLNSIEQKSMEDWLIELARWSPAMPADLQVTLAPVFA